MSADTDADEEARRLASALADQLMAEGHLRTPGWRNAFAQVPRHVFVPHAGVLETTAEGSRYTLLSGDAPDQRDRWLRLVYSDTTLITQLAGHPIEEQVRDGVGRGQATSSSTAPSLMAWMLETLDASEGHQVLEIGTGSGYNAALLSHRLGDAHVVSVDIDAHLVSAARERLDRVGHTPELHVGDGREGYPDRAPYDRVIATCSLPYLPPAWVAQTRPGGLILANIAGPLAGAMLLAEVSEGNVAQGRFLPRWAGFMWARPGFTKARDITAHDTSEGRYEVRTPRVDAEALRDRAFAFLAQLYLPQALPYWASDDDGFPITGLITPDGSWAEVSSPGDGVRAPRVEQGGPRRLWDTVETAHTFWDQYGRPDWSAFGVTATFQHQRVWLHSSDSPNTWELPAPGPGS
ncbi:ATP-grasp peptide maturase system methyltransferase [Halostreptopolyspora alba]|uniref:Protein-L-isoaspartate O-methyltransferase n=1 Tax=Halostreptopolyspora alba TaxID=2487137 RepID=A0A3N0E805_9ACTN|nr:methyltransferase domain-containing protein [Nocardiopsaceae bacterium YIM 96095]